jgi:hypothetical protein
VKPKRVILKQAVELAVAGGYNGGIPARAVSSHTVTMGMTEYNMYEVLFNHSFARALFGDERWKVGGAPDAFLPKYKIMLQEMVLADDIYDYLEANLPDPSEAR